MDASTIGQLAYQPNSASSIAIQALARSGHGPAARALLHTLGDRYRVPVQGNALSSMAWVALGDHEAALRSLEAAAEARDYWLGSMIKQPIIETLRAMPAFVALHDSVFPGVSASDN